MDIVNTTKKQWQTRLLYNAYLPFNYSFIIDSHVYPCDSLAIPEIFDQFKQLGVDIGLGNRMNIPDRILGGAVLSKWGEGSWEFWKRSYEVMIEKGLVDDQEAMRIVRNTEWNQRYSWKLLSSNWIFASHGIDSEGVFDGAGRCYRSSVIVTGPVRWIHGNPDECSLMNGQHYEYASFPRVYYMKGECQGILEGNTVLFSEKEIKEAVQPYRAPVLNWKDSCRKDKLSLCWFIVCLITSLGTPYPDKGYLV